MSVARRTGGTSTKATHQREGAKGRESEEVEADASVFHGKVGDAV